MADAITGLVSSRLSYYFCPAIAPHLHPYLTARNLKYYPLSLREAMKPEQPLEYISSKFFVETCVGEQKLFSELSSWELLNLKPNDILDIPDRLYQEHGMFHRNFPYILCFVFVT